MFKYLFALLFSCIALHADADGVLTTYDETRGSGPLKEDVMTGAVMTNPNETPLFSGLKKREVAQAYFQNLIDQLATPTRNRHIEGDQFDIEASVKATRLFAYAQILYKTALVSNSEIVSSNYLGTSQIQYQFDKKSKELTADFERAFLLSSYVAGASGTAREMTGILAWITTNSTAVNSGTKLTESFFKGLCALIWNQKGKADEVYTCLQLKYVIDSWTSGATKNINLTDRRLGAVTDYYEASGIGLLKVFTHQQMPSTTNSDATLAIINNDDYRIAVLREMKEDITKRNAHLYDGELRVVIGEMGIQCLKENHSAKATGLDTGYVI